MRVLKTVGAIDDMTAAEARDNAERFTAERWEPVAAELEKLEGATGDYEPDQEVLEDVRGYAQETQHGFDHVLRWVRALKTLGAIEDMTAAEARDNAERFLAERWDPVAAELEKKEASAADPNPHRSRHLNPHPNPRPNPRRSPRRSRRPNLNRQQRRSRNPTGRRW